MKSLDSCYEVSFSKLHFIERKITIQNPYTLVLGAPKSGKSYLIYDYLANFEPQQYLYIDFFDFRVDKEEIKVSLEEFIKENKIEILALENFDFSFELPKIDSVIISSYDEYPKEYLEEYEILKVFPLDFEEYLLHDVKHQNTKNSFNNFLKFGNLPEIIPLIDNKKILRQQEIIELFAKDKLELEVLKLYLNSVDEKKSIYQLFTLLKKRFKVSKDKFYSLSKKFEKNLIIYFVQKYRQEKAIKKIYAYNHAYLNSISFNKKFKNEFTNMIFLELLKKEEIIYYLEGVDFYLEEEQLIVLSIPFYNDFMQKQLEKKILNAKKEVEIKKVEVVTIANESEISIDSTECIITPFYEWALL